MKLVFIFFTCVFTCFLTLAQNGPGSGNTLLYDGVNTRVFIPDVPAFDHGNNITIEAWIFPTTYGVVGGIFTKSYTIGGREYSMYMLPDGRIRFDVFDNSSTDYLTYSASIVPLNTWTHVAGTYTFSTGTSRIYLNGILDKTSVIGPVNIAFTSVPPLIGAYWLAPPTSSRGHFKGAIDEVRLWHVARSQTEIRDNMCRSLLTPQANLIAYYRFDEANGLTANDASGNGNNGTLQNFTTTQTNDWNFSGAPIGNESVYNYPVSWAGQTLSLGSIPPGIDEGTLVVDNITGTPTGFHIYRVDSFPSQTSGLTNSIGTYFGTFVVGGTTPSYRTTYKYSGTVFDNFKCESSFRLKQRNDNSVASWALLNNTLDMTANTLIADNNSRKEIILDTTCMECPSFSLNLGTDRYYCTLSFNDVLDAGISGVNYLWSTGASSKTIPVSTPGTYWVEIGISGCPSKRDTIVLTGYQPPVISKDSNFCGTVHLLVDAGSGWSNYHWSNGVNSQVALITSKGQYNVQVSNAHCQFTSNTININSFSAPDLGNDTVLCNGTILSLDAGNEWDTFYWSDGSINQVIDINGAGKYYVGVKNSYCVFHSDTINVVYYKEPDLGKDTIICPGTSYSLDAGNNWNFYSWSNGMGTREITIKEKGYYYVQVKNSYCIFNSNVVYVDFYVAPDLGRDTLVCGEGNLILDAGKGWNSYLWSNGLTSSSISVTKIGEYYVKVKNAYCTVNSDSVFINIVNEEGRMLPNLLTPNEDGMNDDFSLDHLMGDFSIEIYNRWGSLVYNSRQNENEWKPGEFPDGIYYYSLKTGCGSIFKGWIQLIK